MTQYLKKLTDWYDSLLFNMLSLNKKRPEEDID